MQASAREARPALADAEEALAGAKSIQVALDAKAAEAKITLRFAADRVRNLAIETIRAHYGAALARYVAETAAMQVAFNDRKRSLEWLIATGVLDQDETVRAIGVRFMGWTGDRELSPTDAIPIPKWEAMLAALCRDVKAPAVIP